MKVKSVWVLPFATAVLVIAVFFGAGLGAVDLSFFKMINIIQVQMGGSKWTDFSEIESAILLQVRLPRVLMAVLIGAGLSCAGAALQGIFRNPLVDASIMGVSTGASFFASLFILFGSLITFSSTFLADLSLSIFAFIGATITALLVIRIADDKGKINSAALILGGVAINAITASLTGLLIYLADDDELRDLTFWTLGSLGGTNWLKCGLLLPLIGIPFVLIIRKANELNAFSLGESAAFFLGVSVKRTKLIILLAATCMVGSSVAFVGVIGFVGLVVPHIVRLIVGANHQLLLPLSAIIGAILLTISDLISRTILAPTEVPIGIITAILGSPFFLAIILKNKRALTT